MAKKFLIRDKNFTDTVHSETNKINSNNARKGMQARALRMAEDRSRLMETQKLTTICRECGLKHKGTLGENNKWFKDHAKKHRIKNRTKKRTIAKQSR